MKKKRIELLAPPDFGQAANIWGWISAADKTVTLEHDYPDLRPEPGWRVAWDGGLWEVKAVNGRHLSCVENER